MRRLVISSLMILLLAVSVFPQFDSAAPWFEQGLSNANRGRFEQALADFYQALKKYRFAADWNNRSAAKINFNIGVCLYRTGRAGEAVGFLETAIKLAKNNYREAFYALGRVQSELGNWAAAKQALAAAVNLNHRDGEAWFDLGFVYWQEKDLARAALAFQRAIEYESVDAPSAHNNLGVIAAFAGDWLTAAEEFETALALSGGKLPEAIQNLKICRSSKLSREAAFKLALIDRYNRENQRETD